MGSPISATAIAELFLPCVIPAFRSIFFRVSQKRIEFSNGFPSGPPIIAAAPGNTGHCFPSDQPAKRISPVVGPLRSLSALWAERGLASNPTFDEGFLGERLG
jgi:hypothetical protein